MSLVVINTFRITGLIYKKAHGEFYSLPGGFSRRYFVHERIFTFLMSIN